MTRYHNHQRRINHARRMRVEQLIHKDLSQTRPRDIATGSSGRSGYHRAAEAPRTRLEDRDRCPMGDPEARWSLIDMLRFETDPNIADQIVEYMRVHAPELLEIARSQRSVE